MANPSGVKAALLDFDQTLVDLPIDWDTLRRDVSAVFRPHGLRTPMRRLLRGINNAFNALEMRGVPPAERAAIRRKVNGVLRTAEQAGIPKAKAMPGAKQFVQTLRSHRLKIVIQSSNSVRVIQQALDRLGFPRVDAIVGRESAPRVKPHPKGARAALRKLGLRGEDCVVIGDGDFDVELGKAIGATTIRLGEGRQRADYNVRSLSQASLILFGKPVTG